MSFPLLLLAGYLIGAIPTGVILTRLAGVGDIRKAGSGNIGATNVYRVAGRRLGILTLLGDTLKGLLPMLYVVLLPPFRPAGGSGGAGALSRPLFPRLPAVQGGQRGGNRPRHFSRPLPPGRSRALAVFAGVLWKWRFISLASISAASLTPFLFFWPPAPFPSLSPP